MMLVNLNHIYLTVDELLKIYNLNLACFPSGKFKTYEAVKYKKYELVSTHTARRSGATNMYIAVIPTLAIMKITGHKTEKAFLKYIKISEEENAEMLAKHCFFNKQ